MKRLVTTMITAGLLGGVLAGCSHRAAATRPVPQLHVRVQTSGAFTYEGAYVANAGPGRSCRDAARRGNSAVGFLIGPPGTRTLPLYFALHVSGYRGPATYQDPQLGLEGVLVADHGRQTRYRGAAGSLAATVRADGSGSATLTRLVATDGTTLSASLRWTCVTERWPVQPS